MRAPCPACRLSFMSMERNCTVLLHYDKNTPPNEDEIREELEHKEVDKKVSGLKTLISLTLNGEVMPKLLMTVIRFCVPCDNHQIKKLLLIYWEVIDKTGADGKLLPEMILVWCAPRAPPPPPPPPSRACVPACLRACLSPPPSPARPQRSFRCAGVPALSAGRGRRQLCEAGRRVARHTPPPSTHTRACGGSNNLRNDLSHANEYIRGDDAIARSPV